MEVKLIETMGSDLTVVNAARVSFNKESHLVDGELLEKDVKLINYLAEHQHYSPFGHCFATFRIKAPIFVARQLQKHAYLRMNEVSRRYVDDTPEFYKPDTWRGRAKDKKQGSEGEVEVWHFRQDKYYEDCVDEYKYLLSCDVAPEMARMVLPQSMYTEWYWSGSLDAFANMCKLRCKPDTQEETRLIANQISEQMEEKFPVSWRALVNV
ncbi:FAD-dependent thymidylate synthase [Candidatus Dependentiae bacterium]|nr:MAG: FAD-dependent thymidylate synthase [Candidatus Dependentiae bacterium]